MLHKASSTSISKKTRFILTIFSFIATILMISTLVLPRTRVVAESPKQSNEAELRDHALSNEHSDSERVEVEEIVLSADGFKPAELNLSSKRFFLAVVNRAQVEELSLQLNHETHGRLHEVRVPGGQMDWTDSFELPPGRYVLTETNHPDWICRILISPR